MVEPRPEDQGGLVHATVEPRPEDQGACSGTRRPAEPRRAGAGLRVSEAEQDAEPSGRERPPEPQGEAMQEESGVTNYSPNATNAPQSFGSAARPFDRSHDSTRREADFTADAVGSPRPKCAS